MVYVAVERIEPEPRARTLNSRLVRALPLNERLRVGLSLAEKSENKKAATAMARRLIEVEGHSALNIARKYGFASDVERLEREDIEANIRCGCMLPVGNGMFYDPRITEIAKKVITEKITLLGSGIAGKNLNEKAEDAKEKLDAAVLAVRIANAYFEEQLLETVAHFIKLSILYAGTRGRSVESKPDTNFRAVLAVLDSYPYPKVRTETIMKGMEEAEKTAVQEAFEYLKNKVSYSSAIMLAERSHGIITEDGIAAATREKEVMATIANYFFGGKTRVKEKFVKLRSSETLDVASRIIDGTIERDWKENPWTIKKRAKECILIKAGNRQRDYGIGKGSPYGKWLERTVGSKSIELMELAITVLEDIVTKEDTQPELDQLKERLWESILLRHLEGDRIRGKDLIRLKAFASIHDLKAMTMAFLSEIEETRRMAHI